MSTAVLAILAPIVLVVGLVLFVKRRRKKKAADYEIHRRTTIYDASLREKAATTQARDTVKRAAREISGLNAKIKVLERANLETASENARLHRDLNSRWEQIETLARELGSYRDADTLTEMVYDGA